LKVLILNDKPNQYLSGALLRRGPLDHDAVVIIPPELSLDALVEVLAEKVCADNPEDPSDAP
jgi:hypothetical protein